MEPFFRVALLEMRRRGGRRSALVQIKMKQGWVGAVHQGLMNSFSLVKEEDNGDSAHKATHPHRGRNAWQQHRGQRGMVTWRNTGAV
mmetsp:Transcript_47217/g.87733  ORF Transcript_47217/g.87733 Transcript_47217/m.87733 type:complete len:87 (+) Transcript_47217:103-363(+)|eukprot:CAMPEP_0197433488 /NCGR_PEP_ID=MMETSP1175-20131217/1373_1 /TAXON_ID=1003142 /ORGANISM="Triceratium dubium, Strain CCMP147" /LENGTH=86 /DNA_ID=CAMNT_0042961891 /DNA_START=344 /DNA_END=604 /DNA_ORIENTATION=+